jgi:hypothetical protein
MLVAIYWRLEAHYRESYDNNLKGLAFEERCRDLLRQSGATVYPERLQLPFEVLPKEISMELWGHPKTKTDIDVLARIADYVLVLECKEIKPPQESLVKKTHLFEKFAEELYYKTRWLASNLESIRPLMNDDWFGRLFEGADDSWLIPAVVTTFPISMESGLDAPVILYSELAEWTDRVLSGVQHFEEGEMVTLMEHSNGSVLSTGFKLKKNSSN